MTLGLKTKCSFFALAALLWLGVAPSVLTADEPLALDADSTVSILNRSARVQADGTWRIGNIPSGMGPVRVRATSVKNGVTLSGQSDFVTIRPNIQNVVGSFSLGNAVPIPARLTLSAAATTLTSAGATSQITVLAIYPDGSTKNLMTAAEGTSYAVSNPVVATVGANGLVTAVSSGTVLVSALNEGAVGIMRINVAFSGADSDGDGITDDVEITNGMNPNDPVDAKEDPDRDGLSNFEELTITGTNRLVGDTDGDGISDGDEITGKLGKVTSPLLKDTDGDLINDLLEFQTGTDPTDNGSFNFGAALQSFSVTPPVFVLAVGTGPTDTSRQLTVTGVLRDGTTVDLTSTARGTNYASSDLFVANFGSPDGMVFAGSNGSATITVTNGSFSATVDVTVRLFNPSVQGFVTIPGSAQGVAIGGRYAYVAAGSAGLQVVDVTDKRNPLIVAALATPGTAMDVHIVGNLAYVADGESGLQIISVANPLAPSLVGFVDTPGLARDLAVAGGICYLADHESGLQIIDVSNPAAPQIIANYPTLGTASGVDVSGAMVVIAASEAGAEVVNVATPASPQFLGTATNGGNAKKVKIQGSYAYLADAQYGFTTVDLNDPQNPQIMNSIPVATSGALLDVAIEGRYAVGAIFNLFSSFSIIDLQTPAAPAPLSLLQYQEFGFNYQGTGITLDSSYAYVATNRFDGADSRLYIGQYLDGNDQNGNPPEVSIVEPASGAQLLVTLTTTVKVTATDDVGVARVQLFANGALVGSRTAAPYEFAYTAPAVAGQVIFTATATDFGANSTTSAASLLEVIPDPGTTVTGRIADENGQPVAGVNATVFGVSAVSDNAGLFRIEEVPTVFGDFTVKAANNALFGQSASFAVIPNGDVDVGVITVGAAVIITNPPAGAQIIQNSTIPVSVAVVDGFDATIIRLFANGVLVGNASPNPPAEFTYSASVGFTYTAPVGLGPVNLTATATDVDDTTVTSAVRVVEIVADQGVVVTGRIIDLYGQPVAGASVSVFNLAPVLSDNAGLFQITGVPTVLGDIVVSVTAGMLLGQSTSYPAIPNSVVDVGSIMLSAKSLFVDIPGQARDVAVSGNYAYVAAGTAGLQIVDVSDKLNARLVATFDTPTDAMDVQVVGNLAYVADRDSLQIISIANPLMPSLVGSIAMPESALKLAVAGDYCYVTKQGSGLDVIQVTNPAAPQLIANYYTRGDARGVAISGQIAVVAEGWSGLEILSIVDPYNPRLLGSLSYTNSGYGGSGGCSAENVVIKGTYAYVAGRCDFNVIDLTDPRNPREVADSGGGELTDLAIDGRLVFGTREHEYETVQVIDVQDPLVPIPLINMTLNTYGRGITLDGSYFYLAALYYSYDYDLGEYKTQSRLYIGQYFAPTDTLGVAPSVNITEPPSGAQVIQSETITVEVGATDDIAVAKVQLFANGVLVDTDAIAPYEFTYTASVSAGPVTFTATATDFGGNTATSAASTVQVVPDPQTIITGQIVDENGLPVIGIQANVFGSLFALTDDNGVFRITGVPTSRGTFAVSATLQRQNEFLFAESSRYSPVPNGTVDVGTLTLGYPTLNITKLLPGDQLIYSERISIGVSVTSNVGVANVLLYYNGELLDIDDRPPYKFSFQTYQQPGPISLMAIATDLNGKTSVSATRMLQIVEDPGTTVIGKVVDQDGQPVEGAEVYASSSFAVSDVNGVFQLTGIPSLNGHVVVSAYKGPLFGQSGSFIPVPNGVVDVGTIKFRLNNGSD